MSVFTQRFHKIRQTDIFLTYRKPPLSAIHILEYTAERLTTHVVKVDMEMIGVNAEEAGVRVRWRQMIHCGHPRKEKSKVSEEEKEEDEGAGNH